MAIPRVARRPLRRAVGGLALFVASAGARAHAQGITFSFVGTGSGTLGGIPFAPLPFSFAITGDASAVTTALFGPGIPAIPDLGATFNLGELASGTLTNPVYVYDDQAAASVGFGTMVGASLLAVGPVPALATYGLASAIGPLVDPAPTFAIVNLPTSVGALTFTAMADVQFTARVSAAAVPEPATFLLTAGGVAIVGVAARRRRPG